MSYGKKTSDGEYDRIKVLTYCERNTHMILKSPDTAKYLSDRDVKLDDILDALVTAVTAKLGCADPNYELRRLPGRRPTNCCEPAVPEMVYVVKKVD